MVGALRLKGKSFGLGLLTVSVLWLFIISTLGRTNLLLSIGGFVALAGLMFIFPRFHKYRGKTVLLILALIFIPIPLHLAALLSEEPNIPIVKRMENAEHITYSGNFRKLMTSISKEMFSSRPVIGIGAGNFGMRFNEYRSVYASKNPADVNLQVAENEFAERSHNEYLQILAELGVVGALIFLWFLGGIGLILLNALIRFRQTSLITYAAILGLCLFLASSAVSSYSFRMMQNGLVFFFVLAVAAKSLRAMKFKDKLAAKINVSGKYLKFGYAFGIGACLLLTAHCLIRVASVYYSIEARSRPDIQEAKPLYQTAFWLDGENPSTRVAFGKHLFQDKQFAEATRQFEQAAREGSAGSINLSYLASAQTLAGDPAAAETTFAYAAHLYPFSTFVRTRYAYLLQENGKTDESAAQLQIAQKINKPEANTWWTIMNEGTRQASLRASQDKNFVTVSSLYPEAALQAILDEREIKYPGERLKADFSN
jgi:hypothetical protein